MARRSDPLGWGNPPLLILGSLAEGPKHGYAIVKDVQEQAGITLGPGTLYAALSRLEEQGLVEALPGEERRRPYRITAAGASALSERLTEMSRFATTGLSRLSAGVAR
ncbi:PadR family transcriptional regulator [Nonomuraea sediminis]|uniref:PadR family transcriptional regulator n=1 Tax=Nonomuraea sediminis TaxID=2835864 RepID=UPI001BDBD3B2|nr:PadR family transcriptional regulator [Nonomuraea sediminis]